LSDLDAMVIVMPHCDRLAPFGVAQLDGARAGQDRRIVMADPGETIDGVRMIDALTRMGGWRRARNRAMRALACAQREPGDAR
jgi:predicted site-specific integrase-resolvase